LANINLNERQKAFLPTEGIAQNTLLLDKVISSARKNKKTLSIIEIDLSNHSIHRALGRHTFHTCMINYIMDSYTGAVTDITCEPTAIHGINLYRGVKQDNLLSPILFNLVLDELFSAASVGRRYC